MVFFYRGCNTFSRPHELPIDTWNSMTAHSYCVMACCHWCRHHPFNSVFYLKIASVLPQWFFIAKYYIVLPNGGNVQSDCYYTLRRINKGKFLHCFVNIWASSSSSSQICSLPQCTSTSWTGRSNMIVYTYRPSLSDESFAFPNVKKRRWKKIRRKKSKVMGGRRRKRFNREKIEELVAAKYAGRISYASTSTFGDAKQLKKVRTTES